MPRPARTVAVLVTVASTLTLLTSTPVSGSAPPTPSNELSEATRLGDRRALVVGDRAYSMGDASGLYPATGWHIRGEMGGFWSQPIKLLDGLWFGVDGEWLKAGRYTAGYGYQRFEYPGEVAVQRTEFVPDGVRATVIGVTMRSSAARTVKLEVDTHSELLASYPWGWTEPSAAEMNLPDTGRYQDNKLVFSEQRKTAIVGSSTKPAGHALGPDHRGPQDPAVVCPAEGAAPKRCDDSAFGKGTGGRLSYSLSLKANQPRTIWFAVAGSDQSPAEAQREYTKALHHPEKLLKAKIAERATLARYSTVDLPGDRLLQRSVEWSKQNLADSVQEARDLQIRDVDEGKAYPAPAGEVDRARWFGAGFPDYPWLFATDGEYTAYAAVAAGQFDTAKQHLRALREISDLLNNRSGKVVHEVMPTGDVYFGSNKSAGNTDETVKFPSIVALLWRWTGDDRFRDELYEFSVRNLKYVYRELDQDNDGWPEGLANVERSGMGSEKLDSTVYLARGLRDLADLAASKRDRAVQQWAATRADELERRFEAQWWVPQALGYADSIDDPANPANDNTPIFQRHWTGVTPMEAELVRPGKPVAPLASPDHAATALTQREKPCYTGEFGLFHTGSGPTADPGGNPGPSCDPVVSAVKSERSIFSLNTAIMAVAEGNYGRLGQQWTYTTGNARIQLDPKVWETPGAMPEIAPSPDFPANIDRPMYDRSMMLQAWGTYGVLWPVIHQQLGVRPDLGRNRLAVVPQLPPGQQQASGTTIRLGRGSVEVRTSLTGKVLSTDIRIKRLRPATTIGAVLPTDGRVATVRLDGERVPYRLVRTARGTEVHVTARDASARLLITLR